VPIPEPKLDPVWIDAMDGHTGDDVALARL
jgi:hypothetical protein